MTSLSPTVADFEIKGHYRLSINYASRASHPIHLQYRFIPLHALLLLLPTPTAAVVHINYMTRPSSISQSPAESGNRQGRCCSESPWQMWGLFHRSLAPNVELAILWPPVGINASSVLLASGFILTLGHHALIQG